MGSLAPSSALRGEAGGRKGKGKQTSDARGLLVGPPAREGTLGVSWAGSLTGFLKKRHSGSRKQGPQGCPPRRERQGWSWNTCTDGRPPYLPARPLPQGSWTPTTQASSYKRNNSLTAARKQTSPGAIRLREAINATQHSPSPQRWTEGFPPSQLPAGPEPDSRIPRGPSPQRTTITIPIITSIANNYWRLMGTGPLLSPLQPPFVASSGMSTGDPAITPLTGGETEARGVSSFVQGCRAGRGARNVSRAGTGGRGPACALGFQAGRLGGQPPGPPGWLLGFLWQPPQLFIANRGEGGTGKEARGSVHPLSSRSAPRPVLDIATGGDHTACHMCHSGVAFRSAHW